MRIRWAVPVPDCARSANFSGAPISRDSVSAMSCRRLLYSDRMARSRSSRSLRVVRENAGKGRLRRGDGAIDVLGAADGDLGERLLGGRIDHVEQLRLQRIDPGSVHVVLLFMLHLECLQTITGRDQRGVQVAVSTSRAGFQHPGAPVIYARI